MPGAEAAPLHLPFVTFRLSDSVTCQNTAPTSWNSRHLPIRPWNYAIGHVCLCVWKPGNSTIWCVQVPNGVFIRDPLLLIIFRTTTISVSDLTCGLPRSLFKDVDLVHFRLQRLSSRRSCNYFRLSADKRPSGHCCVVLQFRWQLNAWNTASVIILVVFIWIRPQDP